MGTSCQEMSFPEKYPMVCQFEYAGKLFFGGDPLGLTSPSRLQEIRESFEVREDDVVVASFPRSGTHWTAEIASCILHDERRLEESHVDRVPYLDFTPPECKVTMEVFNGMPRDAPRIYLTHLTADLAPKMCTSKGKVICAIRNPKDVAVSLFHLYRITTVLGSYAGPWSDFLEAYINGKAMWGDYFDHVLSWWARREDENVLIVRYEEMRKNPLQAVRNIAAFLGKTLTEEEVEKIALKTSFEVMKQSPLTNVSLQGGRYKFIFVDKEPGVDFVRKGSVGNWKEYFTVAQNEQFDQLIEEKLRGSGISYEYE